MLQPTGGPCSVGASTKNDDSRDAKRCKINGSQNEISSPGNNTFEQTTILSDISLFDPSILKKYITFYSQYKPPKKKTKNIPPEILMIRRSIQHSCRDNSLSKGLEILQKAAEECVYIEPQSFYNLLNLCEGSFGKGQVHVGTPRPRKEEGSCERDTKVSNQDADEISLSHRLSYANEIHSLLSVLNIPCTEPTYTALIRLASRCGDFDQSERYLDEAEKTQQCKGKLRMYSALLRGYCGDYDEKRIMTKDRLIKALRVWVRMFHHSGTDITQGAALFGEGISPKISLSEIEYASLIKAATMMHDGPVMERLLSDLAEKVLVPGLETMESILNWFRADDKCVVGPTDSVLEEVHLPPAEGFSIGSVCNNNGGGWKIYKGCKIDVHTGQLTLGLIEDTFPTDIKDDTFKLKPVELSDDAWAEMRRMNSKIVVEGQVEGHVSQYQGGGKGKKRPRSNNSNTDSKNNNTKSSSDNSQAEGAKWRNSSWSQFESFLDSHPKYNIVIDGANVGYFQQNFSNAPKHVDYKQIDWLVRHLLESSNEHHIILFLHERHFSPKLCPSWAFNLIKEWDGNQSPYDKLTVYRTPTGMNDDWYWMHAALMAGGKSDYLPILAITNDEMRDHHFQMLAQGSFLRWKERHQVHFDFGSYDKQLGRRKVLLQYPRPYSRRIQRVNGVNGSDAIVIPLPKKGDERRYLDGYHVADDSAPEEETYVVVCNI